MTGPRVWSAPGSGPLAAIDAPLVSPGGTGLTVSVDLKQPDIDASTWYLIGPRLPLDRTYLVDLVVGRLGEAAPRP